MNWKNERQRGHKKAFESSAKQRKECSIKTMHIYLSSNVNKTNKIIQQNWRFSCFLSKKVVKIDTPQSECTCYTIRMRISLERNRRSNLVWPSQRKTRSSFSHFAPYSSKSLTPRHSAGDGEQVLFFATFLCRYRTPLSFSFMHVTFFGQ